MKSSRIATFALAVAVSAGAVFAADPPPLAYVFEGPPPPGAKYFDCLTANIEKLLETGKSPYPVERTLLTSGILDVGMESLQRHGQRLEVELDVRYSAPESSGFCRGAVS